jgi:hypothetical protein
VISNNSDALMPVITKGLAHFSIGVDPPIVIARLDRAIQYPRAGGY